MKIRWYGHACFVLESETGVRVLTDPFDNTVGYPIPDVTVDIITVSHHHHDHNYVSAIKGDPVIIDGVGEYTVGGISIRGYRTYHDDVIGEKRGENTLFTIDMDGMRICHCGDLGHLLDMVKLHNIMPVDVLLVPVGGTFTIDAAQAAKLVEDMKPRLTIPMHFKTRALSFPLDPVDRFLRIIGKNQKIDSNQIEIDKEHWEEVPPVVVLDYKK
jgi:L-ascorbate metabolism protein UlaG (beta-lactamase superfamily)